MLTLTLILTDRCDGGCCYCPQKATGHTLPTPRALLALERLLPLLDNGQNLSIHFYGGEPLLEKETILAVLANAANHYRQGKLHYAMTSNGSRLDEQFLQAITLFPFELIISHDGLWQQENRPGIPAHMTLAYFESLLSAHPTIKAHYNCVCPPNQIHRLAENIAHFKEKTQRTVHFALDSLSPWSGEALEQLDRQLSAISDAGLGPYCPDFFTAPKPALFSCNSAERMAIDPVGYIWGCYQYYDLFMQHPQAGHIDRQRVGHIDMAAAELAELIAAWPRCELLEQRQWLAGDEACVCCDQFMHCRQCPVNGAYTRHELGRLPAWLCGIQRVLSKHRGPFDQISRLLSEAETTI